MIDLEENKFQLLVEKGGSEQVRRYCLLEGAKQCAIEHMSVRNCGLFKE